MTGIRHRGAAQQRRFLGPMVPAMIRMHRKRRPTAAVDFGAVARAGLVRLRDLLTRRLPGGRIEGTEYVALNPRRSDHRPGSFKINLDTDQWADFAVAGACGCDVVSLAAYLGGIGQVEAAERLAAMLGIIARHAR
jgi:hypothetical protein